MVNCWVHGCESAGFRLHELKKRTEWAALPAEVVVCELHRGELSEPDSEWMMVYNNDGTRDLYVGMALRKLNEYIVLESPSEVVGYSPSARLFSRPSDAGLYMPVQVRQRGKETPETIALVMSREMLTAFAERLSYFADRHPPQGQ